MKMMQVMAVGLAGVLSLKFLLPLLGMALGLAGLVVKFAIMAAIGYFVLSLLKSRKKDRYEA